MKMGLWECAHPQKWFVSEKVLVGGASASAILLALIPVLPNLINDNKDKPPPPAGTTNIGNMYFVNNLNKIEQEYEKAHGEPLTNQDVKEKIQRALALAEKGGYQNAIALLEEVAPTVDVAAIANNLGVLRANAGDMESARKDFDRAIEKNPNDKISKLNAQFVKPTADKHTPPPGKKQLGVEPGFFFGDAPPATAGEYEGELAMMEAKYYQVSLRKGQELRAIGQFRKTSYQEPYNRIKQTFSVTIYSGAFAVAAREKVGVSGNPIEPFSVRAACTAESDGPAYIAIAASDNQGDNEEPVPVSPEGSTPKPSSYTLRIKVEGEAASASGAMSSVAHQALAPGRNLDAAPELQLPAMVSAGLKLGGIGFYKFPVKKGEVIAVSAAVQKPWYRAGYNRIQTTYTLTVYDDDQMQVGQKKIDVKMNPPDAQTLAGSWPVAIGGNAYLSISAVNSGDAIEPGNFDPGPGRLSVQVTTEEFSGAPKGNENTPKPNG